MAQEIRKFLGRNVSRAGLPPAIRHETDPECPVCLHEIWPPGARCTISIACGVPGCNCVEAQRIEDADAP